MISYKLQTLCLPSDVDDLLCQIDTKLTKIAKSKLDSIRYGVDCDIDEVLFDTLEKYKYILVCKVNNSVCLLAYKLDDIISNIKQYLTSGKPQNFKKSTTLEDTTDVSNVPVKFNVGVFHNHYGNHATYFHTSNNFVTNNTVEDVWEQTDW